ncbi:MAG: pantetheine-phosphate adenylyltransferase [Proteobacteria bacterium]|nr:pantetheine-phosphate adenylyltransferase [Pseudomonadota bacterium]
MKKDHYMKVVYPGTFDPMTIGHTEIINRVSNIFDNLVIAIAEHTRKKTIFDVAERMEIARNEIYSLSLENRVSVVSFSGLLVNFIKQNNISVVIRGVRAVSDFDYEFQMAYCNRKLYSGAETIFIPTGEKGHFISSTLAKEVARHNGDLTNIVSKDVAQKLKQYFFKKSYQSQ